MPSALSLASAAESTRLSILAGKRYVQIPFPVVPLNDFIRTDIPDHYGPAAILALRNDAFEIQVFDRMILSGACQPANSRFIRKAFRHGPRFQHIVHFEAEIVVKVAGRMLLDDKPAFASLCAAPRQRESWFSRGCKVSFRRVFPKLTFREQIEPKPLEDIPDQERVCRQTWSP